MSKGKILIVDDNPNVVKLLEINLNFEDYAVVCAYDGQMAIEKVIEESPDLVILDLVMPKMNGWEVLEAIRSNAKIRNTPVIMLTGSQEKDDIQRGYSKDVVDYVAKPFNTKKLMELINKTLLKEGEENKVETPASKHPPLGEVVNIAIIGSGSNGINLLRILSGNSKIQILGYSDADTESEGSKLARMLNILYADNPLKILKLQTLNIILDSRMEPDSELLRKIEEKNIRYIGGEALEFVLKLLAEKETISDTKGVLLKELNLRVKELSVLYDISKFLNSRLDLRNILEGAMKYLLRIIPISGCCVYLYEDRDENYNLSQSIGLPSDFVLPVLDKHDGFIRALQDDETTAISSAKGKDNKNKQSQFLKELERCGFKSADSFPLYTKDRLRGFFILVSKEEHALTPQEASLVSTIAAEIDISIDNALLNELALTRQKNIEKLLSQLIYAQEDERRRIASEIHDGTAQSLVGILTKIQTSIDLVRQDPARAITLLEQSREIISDNVKEIRHIIFNLRPTSLDDLGLISAIQVYVNRFTNEENIKVHFETNMQKNSFPPALAISMFRIIQESLNNIKRHSDATRVDIKMILEDKNIKMEIVDNGKGFDINKAREKMLIGSSFGLAGMQERVAMLDGTLTIQSRHNEGTKIIIKIPYEYKMVNN